MTHPYFCAIKREEMLPMKTASFECKIALKFRDLKMQWANLILKASKIGLPWWPSGQESACQCRGHGFQPWSGKIPHAAEPLSPCATTTEPVL